MNHATVVLRLRGSPAAPGSLESAVVDAVWAAATPEESIEHVHARVIGNCLYVTVFPIGRNPGETRAIATEICRRTISASPFLSRIVHGDITTIVLPLGPLPLNRRAIDPPHDR